MDNNKIEETYQETLNWYNYYKNMEFSRLAETLKKAADAIKAQTEQIKALSDALEKYAAAAKEKEE